MIADLTSEILAEVAGQTLEEAAFVFAEPEDMPQPWASDIVVTELEFSRPDESGKLILAVSINFASEVSANLLGIDAEDEEAAIGAVGAIKEILNIVGGVAMERFYGKDAAQIGIPEAETMDDARYAGLLEQAVCKIHLLADMEHRLDFLVIINENG